MRRLSLISVFALALASAGCAGGEFGPTDYTGTSQKPLAEAKRWVGSTVRKDRKELKTLMANAQVGQPVDPVVVPWCAGFANAVLVNTGFQSTGSLAARSFLNYGISTKNPDEGDIVVLRRGRSNWTGHVGFFMGYEYYEGIQYVRVLGGNTNKAVDIGYYPVSRILGFRKPETMKKNES